MAGIVFSSTAPVAGDSPGITLQKILQVVNGGGSSLYVHFTQAPTSSTPGVEGNYGSFGSNLYVYTGGIWYSMPINIVP